MQDLNLSTLMENYELQTLFIQALRGRKMNSFWSLFQTSATIADILTNISFWSVNAIVCPKREHVQHF